MNHNDGSRRPAFKNASTTQIMHPIFGKHSRTEGKTLRASAIDYCEISCFKNIREAILMSLIYTII